MAARYEMRHTQPKAPTHNIDLSKIHQQINILTREIKSCWPYPNKDRKAEKVTALNELIALINDRQTVRNAVAQIEQKYKNVNQGRLSHRTRDLLNDLTHAH